MTIDIHRPELEALIRERMRTGAFNSVEDALMQALESTSPPSPGGPEQLKQSSSLTGAYLVAAMQASPCKDLELESNRDRLPVRESSF